VDTAPVKGCGCASGGVNEGGSRNISKGTNEDLWGREVAMVQRKMPQ